MTRGFCGIGVYHLKKAQNVGTLFRSALALGADFIFVIGQRYRSQASDTPKAWRHLPFYDFATDAQFLANRPREARLIGLESDAASRPLSGFIHPERCIYLLGAEDYGLPEPMRRQCDAIVEVDGGSLCLNVATAGSIVLWHRLVQITARRAVAA